ncbi:MAG: nitroreductase family protein [Gemmatimonadaceae bacterium]|nr:nitroreductase family protein [Gemmatimonadaceae bacterium]
MPRLLTELAQSRHTLKVLAETPLNVQTDRAAIEQMLAAAGSAPFHLIPAPEHREGSTMPGIVPWRFRLLDVAACRALRAWLVSREDKSTYPRLLNACTTLALVTWLPDAPKSPLDAEAGEIFAGTQQNTEHLAATGAAVQTFLLAATERGLPTFWASGGPLKSSAAFEHLGIPPRELLAGAVFVFPPEHAGAETMQSKLRDKRPAPAEWSCWL